ncbi:DEAD/DEAH box helicase [Microbacterium sp. cx-55]|uniref:DEAD/DEAH box helicase n=1 Tax=Microbacterium sp. cx-55 TaxID=2875948 RepID=UPI001CBE990A|nr:DEAD/DEAH box helicase [Microbacterium sp. cx-55]MBZ4487379.1 DEAD/DEAH box helicase [Microbacterium sp. cx-55]UGB35399.1 DEAD/DEAH box helicase [Microbacterium sp. cx-55]
MPKNKKPAGGRPAKNFEPRYGSKTSYQDRKRRPGEASAGTTGSKSAGHRGYRAEEATAEAPKRRWTASDRAGRDESRSIRTTGRDERPARSFDDRPQRRVAGERPARSFDDRAPRTYGDRPQRDDRAPRTYGDRPQRDDRAPRTYGDRPARDDRGARSYGDRPARDDRAPRTYGDRPQRDDRAPRTYGDRPARDDRAPRTYGDRPQRDDRGARSYGDRPARDDRAPRTYGDRPQRDDRAPRTYSDRPQRDDRARRDERPARSFDERPARTNSDRPQRDERPARSFNDRPQRSFSDRPAQSDRPRRTSDERPARSSDDRAPRTDRPRRTDGPGRSDWKATPKAYDAHVDTVHERLEAESVVAESVEGQGFGEIGLGDNIVKALAELGAASPFPIQTATIPSILEGRDVLGRGRTGSGKTIAFGAPLVENVLRSQKGSKREFGRKPRALILAPTRELALQIDRTVQPIARSVGLFTTQIYGGVPQARQVGALKKGVDIIIGTPGRIEDLVNQGKLDLSQVQIAVLDEADHMAELGFVEPVQRILRETAPNSQKLLFSATLDREVAALVDEFLRDPAVYEVAGETQESSTIEHRVFVIDHRDKAEMLTSLVDREGKTLVFARTRAYAEMLAESFEDAGIAAVALHGDLNQAKRTRNLQRMTDGKVRVLVATDVAARGIHVDDIDLVVQADAPDEFKAYLHRSGRTGRAGRSGTVVTLVTRQRRRRMTELLGRAEIDAPFDEVRLGDDVIEEVTGRQLADVAN